MSANRHPIVTHLNYTSRGGAGRAALRLHQALLELGWLSFFVSVDNGDETPPIPNGISIKLVEDWLTPEEKLQKRFLDYLNWNYLQQNRTEISNTRFSFPYPGIDILDLPIIQASDIIHLHWIPNFVTPTTLKKLIAKGKKIVWSFHDEWAMTGGCHYDAGCNLYQTNCRNCPQLQVDAFHLTESVLWDKQKQFGQLDITIITPSQWLAECVRKSLVFKDKPVVVLPNPLETDIFRPLPEEEIINNKRLLFGDECLVILFGNDFNQEKRKGFEVLVKVMEICQTNSLFSQLVRQGKIALAIFGNSPPQKTLGNIPVFHLGNLDTDEKLVTAMNLADLFLFPSLQDNYPNTVVEAMSCGMPVMAFNTGGLPDLIQHNFNGFLVDAVGSASAFAEALLAVIANLDNLQHIRTNVRNRITPSHDFKYLGQKFIDLYLSLQDIDKPNRQKAVKNSPSLAQLFEKVTASYDLDLEEAFSGLTFKSEIIESLGHNFQQMGGKSSTSWQVYVNQLYPELLDKIPTERYFELAVNLAYNSGETLTPDSLSQDFPTDTKWTNITGSLHLTPEISLQHPLILKLVGLGDTPENLPDILAIYANNTQLITRVTQSQDNSWELTALIPLPILQLASPLYLRFTLVEEIPQPLKLLSLEIKKQTPRAVKINLTENFLGIGWDLGENTPGKFRGRWLGKKATLACQILLTPFTKILIQGNDIATDNPTIAQKILDSLKVWVNDILVEKIHCHSQENNQWLFEGVVALTPQETPCFCNIRLESDYDYSLSIETLELLPVVLNNPLSSFNVWQKIHNNLPKLPKNHLGLGVILEDEIIVEIGAITSESEVEIQLLGKLLETEFDFTHLHLYFNNHLLDISPQSHPDLSCLITAQILQDILADDNQLRIVSQHNPPLGLTQIYLHPPSVDNLILRANSSFNSLGLYPPVIRDEQTRYRWLGKHCKIHLPIPLVRSKPILTIVQMSNPTDSNSFKNLQLLVNKTVIDGVVLEEADKGLYYQACIFPPANLEYLETTIELIFPSETKQKETTEFINSGLLLQDICFQSIDKLERKIICLDDSQVFGF